MVAVAIGLVVEAADIVADFVVEGIEDNLDTADSAEVVVGIAAADSSTAIVLCNNYNSIWDIEVVFVAAVWVLL